MRTFRHSSLRPNCRVERVQLQLPLRDVVYVLFLFPFVLDFAGIKNDR